MKKGDRVKTPVSGFGTIVEVRKRTALVIFDVPTTGKISFKQLWFLISDLREV